MIDESLLFTLKQLSFNLEIRKGMISLVYVYLHDTEEKKYRVINTLNEISDYNVFIQPVPESTSECNRDILTIWYRGKLNKGACREKYIQLEFQNSFLKIYSK